MAYRLDKVYAKAGSYEDLIKELKQHRAARYRATEYLTDDAKKSRNTVTCSAPRTR